MINRRIKNEEKNVNLTNGKLIYRPILYKLMYNIGLITV